MNPSSHTADAALCAARLLAALAVLVMLANLAGCGGGGDADDGAVATPRVDCVAHPELCK